MKHQPYRAIAAALVAMSASAGWALSFGRAQGLPLIGRPLDLTVPLQLDAGDTVPECADAEVFYGDTRLGGRAAVQVQNGPGGASLRVRNAAPLDEPVVTVYLHLGCGNRFTRRFVLLAEQPGADGEAPRAQAPATAAVRTAPAVPGLIAPPASASGASTIPPGGQRAQAAQETGRPGQGRAAPAQAGTPARASARSPAGTHERVADATGAREGPTPRQPAAAAQPSRRERLRLEPLDLAAVNPSLRSSTVIATAEDPQQRAAASALWAALNAQPQDFLRHTQRLEAMEKDLTGLRESVRRNEAAVGDLQGQLQQARAERFANPLVYALALLALLAVIAALFFWRRARHAGAGAHAWWRAPDAPDAPDSGHADLATAPAPVAPGVTVVSAREASRPAAAPDPVDFDLDAAAPAAPGFEAVPSRAHPDLQAAPQDVRHDDFDAAGPPSLRSLKAVELHDVQQEADFFLALGEHERAIEVLRSHIRSHPETSALAWMDLLDIHHRLGRREEFEQVRSQFQRQFNARVPSFDAYHEDEGPGLEGYENAMSRITALWPSRRVLDVIEESIFRPPGHDGRPAFSLQAYRELLMLHHVGTEVLDRAAAGPGWESSSLAGFSRTNIQPLSATGAAAASEDGAAGLDLDLGIAEQAQPEPWLGPAPAAQGGDSHLLDFDLPDIDVSQYKAKKTRE